MIRIQEILDKVAANNHDANLELIQKAYVFAATAHAGQTRLSGEPYLSHPLAVAYTLADMGFDEPTVAAGLLHDTVEDTGTTIEEIDDKFGEDVADIVDGVTKISMIVFENKEEAQAENIRKMILAMSHDMRVLMVKLADRLHNMSTLDFQKPHKQRRIAQETMDIYAPLANRLGLYLLKRQLEDLNTCGRTSTTRSTTGWTRIRWWKSRSSKRWSPSSRTCWPPTAWRGRSTGASSTSTASTRRCSPSP